MSLDARYSRTRWDLYDDNGLSSLAGTSERGRYLGMLTDDLSNRHYSYKCRVVLDAEDQASADRFMRTFLSRLSPHGSVRTEGVFWSLVDAVSYELLLHQRCVAEVFLGEPDSEDAGDDRTIWPQIDVLPGWSLRRRRGHLWQADPPAAGGWRSLRGATLVDFKLDRQLASSLRRARRELALLDGDFGQTTKLVKSGVPGYDFLEHTRRLHQIAAKSTAGIGWDGRGLFLDRATDSLRIYRRLRFHRTWLEILEAIQVGLNQALSRTESAHAPRTVSVEGVPTLSEIDEAMRSVRNGSSPLDEIRRSVISPRY